MVQLRQSKFQETFLKTENQADPRGEGGKNI